VAADFAASGVYFFTDIGTLVDYRQLSIYSSENLIDTDDVIVVFAE